MTKTKTRGSLNRRGKFLIASLAVTAALAGTSQAVAPAGAAPPRIYGNDSCQGLSFYDWVKCEQEVAGRLPY